MDFTVDPYSGLISRRENYDSTVRKRLQPLNRRLSRPILYGGGGFAESYLAMLRVENYAASIFSNPFTQHLNAVPQSVLIELFRRTGLSKVPMRNVSALSKSGSAFSKFPSSLLRVIDLAAAEAFIGNYCTTYVYRFIKAAVFKVNRREGFDAISRAAFNVNFGVALAGKFFDSPVVSFRSLFSPMFFLLGAKVESSMNLYKEKKNLMRIAPADALFIVSRKLAYLFTCRAVESSFFLSSPSLAISNYLFFMKICNTTRPGTVGPFSVGECHQALLDKIRVFAKVFRNVIRNVKTFSKITMLKMRVLGVKIAKLVSLLKLGVFIPANRLIASLEHEARSIRTEFEANKADGAFYSLLPPRPISLGRGVKRNPAKVRYRQSAVLKKKQCGSGKVLDYIFSFKPGLLSLMENAEEKNELFRALKPIKRLDYYRETDDTYSAAGAIPKRRELLRRVRAAREDRKRAYELFSNAAAGSRESIPLLLKYVREELKKAISRLRKKGVSRRLMILVNIIARCCSFVTKLDKKINAGRSVRADGRSIRVVVERVRQLIVQPSRVWKYGGKHCRST